ncbi:hypothetical protein ACWIHP_30950, partial [Nocardia fluminea]
MPPLSHDNKPDHTGHELSDHTGHQLETSSAGHDSHSGHGEHAGHGDHVAMFRRLFWVMLVLAIPVV